jgi:cell division protein FtsQ
VAVLGAAPRELRDLVGGIRWDAAGLHVELRPGPRLDFGGAGRARAKWAAAARVLSDPRAAGASYLDLRVPDRPLAGTFADEGPTDGGLLSPAQVATGGSAAEVEPETSLDLR